LPSDLFRAGADRPVEQFAPAHASPHAPPGQRGEGVVEGTWLACEEPGREEGWLVSGIDLVMDSRLAAGAVIGRHTHGDTEELYLVLEGALTVIANDGGPGSADQERLLRAGDLHRIGPGGSHSAAAGPEGARILVVKARVP
jgi:quercetin dioxygenase-like cupin family protein